MKRVIYLLMIICISILPSCDSHVSQGRSAYKKYFNETLKDPSSFIVHSEKFTKEGEYTVNWILDIGAKNSFGGYIREAYKIKTVGDKVVSIEEYTPDPIQESDKKTFVSPKVSFVYKKKIVPGVVLVNDYINKEVTLKDDICGSPSHYDLTKFIEAINNKDNEKFNMYINLGVTIIRKGETIKIKELGNDRLGDFFLISYKGKEFYIEQSAIF